MGGERDVRLVGCGGDIKLVGWRWGCKTSGVEVGM